MLIIIKLKDSDESIDIIGLKEQIATCLEPVADIERIDVCESMQEGE